MDWDRYKRACDRPNVFSRWMIEQTRELIARELIARELIEVFDAALGSAPLPRPAGHKGGTELDMFALELTPRQVSLVLERVRHASAAGATTSATRERGLAGFVEAWAEYARALERC